MTLYRVVHNKDNPYLTINTTITKDTRLSWKAKGIWLYAFSRPDDWHFKESDLIRQSTDCRRSVRSGLKELEENGYLVRLEQEKNEAGQFEKREWYFFETPQTKEEIQKMFPMSRFAPTENVTTVSTEENLIAPIPNNELLNIDKIIIKEDTLPPPPDPIDDDDFFKDKSQDPPPSKEPLATALYPCLDKLDLNPEFKKGIPHMKTATGQRITKELIEKAVAICLERLDDIGCVEAYFTKIIKNPEGFPDTPKKCDIVKQNIKIAQRYQAHIKDPTLTYDIAPEYVEIGKYPSYDYVHLDEMNFEGKLKQALAKRNITLEE